MLISFDDQELDLLVRAARSLPVSSRDSFLRLISEQLKPRSVDLNPGRAPFWGRAGIQFKAETEQARDRSS